MIIDATMEIYAFFFFCSELWKYMHEPIEINPKHEIYIIDDDVT